MTKRLYVVAIENGAQEIKARSEFTCKEKAIQSYNRLKKILSTIEESLKYTLSINEYHYVEDIGFKHYKTLSQIFI